MSYIEIKNNIFQVGDTTMNLGLDCNPYLIIDGDEAVLFDPGSVLDFEIVLENVLSLVTLDQIKYVVVHHQDPDFCSALPLLEKAGLNAQIVTSWRAMTLIQFYGVKSPFYLIEEHDDKLIFGNGKTLEFINTPYLHFPGAFVTYDRSNKILLSSDLFGAFSYNRTLYADEHYLEKMKAFHEHYVPSNSVLRPAMDVLKLYDIEMILPQHGSIIKSDIGKYIEALRTLECGSILRPIKKNLMEVGGYLIVFNEVYQHLVIVYRPSEVHELYKHTQAFTFNEFNEIVAYEGNPKELWQSFFYLIYEVKGMIWLTVIEPFIRNLCAIYDLEIPSIMLHSLAESDAENRKLIDMNQSLNQTIKMVNEKLVKCPITDLYNERFLHSLLIEELKEEDWRDVGALVCISIDDFSKYKLKYGSNEEDAVFINLAYMLKASFGEQSVYKLDEADFGLYLKGYDQETIINKVEQFRVDVEQSDNFLGRLTVSIGASFPNELDLDAVSLDHTVENYFNYAYDRLRLSKQRGKNYFSYQGEINREHTAKTKVLIVDSDVTNLEILKTFINELEIEVLTATDGAEGLMMAKEHLPNLIISDIILEKIDGFLFREELQKSSKTKNIEMLYLSHQKDEASVKRALELGVVHYLKKPYMLSEIIGIVKKNQGD